MKLYLASGNAHKVQELQALVDADGSDLEIISAKAVGGMPDVVEDTGTFVGNARKKAYALLERLPPGSWVLSDDSGICVDALDGGPGVESAYYAGPQGDSAANLRKLIATMRDVPEGKRGARFVCFLVLVRSAVGQTPPSEEIFEGICEGRLGFEPRGGNGFGYDPLFIPNGFDLTTGEMSEAQKNTLSHRARAAQKMLIRFAKAE